MNSSAGLIHAWHSMTGIRSGRPTPQEFGRRSGNADIVIIAKNPHFAEAILQVEHLKMIDGAFTGIDHIDAAQCKSRDINVCNAETRPSQNSLLDLHGDKFRITKLTPPPPLYRRKNCRNAEPPLPEDYPLLSAPTTILAPHVGFTSKESCAGEQRASSETSPPISQRQTGKRIADSGACMNAETIAESFVLALII